MQRNERVVCLLAWIGFCQFILLLSLTSWGFFSVENVAGSSRRKKAKLRDQEDDCKSSTCYLLTHFHLHSQSMAFCSNTKMELQIGQNVQQCKRLPCRIFIAVRREFFILHWGGFSPQRYTFITGSQLSNNIEGIYMQCPAFFYRDLSLDFSAWISLSFLGGLHEVFYAHFTR